MTIRLKLPILIGLLLTISIILIKVVSHTVTIPTTVTLPIARPIARPRVTTAPFWLHRGMPITHTRAKEAAQGIIKSLNPKDGHNDPAKHQDGDTRSVFSSTTTCWDVAVNYTTDMYTGEKDGYILSVLSTNVLGMSKLAKIDDKVRRGDIFNEAEYLIEGTVTGCVVTRIYPEMTEVQIRNIPIEKGLYALGANMCK